MKWHIWRPVVEGYGSLMEVKRQWTIDDLFDAHDILDIKDEKQRANIETQRGS